MKDRKHFLDTAETLINGPRAKEYGPAKLNHMRIAEIWSIILARKLDEDITPEEVVACMVGLKLARLAEDISCLLYTSPSPRDLSTSRMPSSA